MMQCSSFEAAFTRLPRTCRGTARAVLRAMFNLTSSVVLVASLLTVACGRKSEPSKPATCAEAGQLLSKRFGEFADKANFVGEKRAALDKAMAATVSEHCTADAWDDVALGCLGAVATIRDGSIDVATYNKAIDTCTDAIGKDKSKKLDDAVGATVRAAAK